MSLKTINTNIEPSENLKQRNEILSAVVSVMTAEQAKTQVASHLSESLTLNERTLKWGVDRNIIGENGKGTKYAQAEKLLEEAQETYDAVLCRSLDEIKDGIGDVIVSATLLAHMYGLTMEECHNTALKVIEKRTGIMIKGTFVKDVVVDPDDDFNEPLGKACQLGDETCESCQ